MQVYFDDFAQTFCCFLWFIWILRIPILNNGCSIAASSNDFCFKLVLLKAITNVLQNKYRGSKIVNPFFFFESKSFAVATFLPFLAIIFKQLAFHQRYEMSSSVIISTVELELLFKRRKSFFIWFQIFKKCIDKFFDRGMIFVFATFVFTLYWYRYNWISVICSVVPIFLKCIWSII